MKERIMHVTLDGRPVEMPEAFAAERTGARIVARSRNEAGALVLDMTTRPLYIHAKV